MLRLDILGILTTLFLIDILSWKRVLVISFTLNFVSFVVLLFFQVSFVSFNMAGVFSYFQVTSSIYELANFLPFIFGLIFSRSVDKNKAVDISYISPWKQSEKWSVLFYKFGYYSLFIHLTRLVLRS